MSPALHPESHTNNIRIDISTTAHLTSARTSISALTATFLTLPWGILQIAGPARNKINDYCFESNKHAIDSHNEVKTAWYILYPPTPLRQRIPYYTANDAIFTALNYI